MTEFKIVIDSREQLPFDFHCQELNHGKVLTERKTLKTGDYSIQGLEDKITIERKSLSDLFSSVGSGRKRFEREMERMSKFDYAALVVESSLADIFTNPPNRSKMPSKSVFRTLIAWSQRYNVHLWPMWDRQSAERVTYLLLKRYWDDLNDGKRLTNKPL